LVLARGHRIEQLPEVPLVVADAAESITKTSKALEVLKAIGAIADVEKAKTSRNIRRGKGKMRNRRYIQRKGPLLVYNSDEGVGKAFRNLPGVETCSVDALNLLQLAPGGHVGRFIIWTQSAFEKLDKIFGSSTTPSAVKKGFKFPRIPISTVDIARVINSDEIQSIVRPPKDNHSRVALKKNPLKNLGVMLKLNPYAKTARRNAAILAEKQAAVRAAKLVKIKAGQSAGLAKDKKIKELGKTFYKSMLVESEYTGEDYDEFSNWLGTTEKA